MPGLFLHAEDDNLIGKHHVERLVRCEPGEGGAGGDSGVRNNSTGSENRGHG